MGSPRSLTCCEPSCCPAREHRRICRIRDKQKRAQVTKVPALSRIKKRLLRKNSNSTPKRALFRQKAFSSLAFFPLSDVKSVIELRHDSAFLSLLQNTRTHIMTWQLRQHGSGAQRHQGCEASEIMFHVLVHVRFCLLAIFFSLCTGFEAVA
jgi:hypothetical protein